MSEPGDSPLAVPFYKNAFTESHRVKTFTDNF